MSFTNALRPQCRTGYRCEPGHDEQFHIRGIGSVTMKPFAYYELWLVGWAPGQHEWSCRIHTHMTIAITRRLKLWSTLTRSYRPLLASSQLRRRWTMAWWRRCDSANSVSYESSDYGSFRTAASSPPTGCKEGGRPTRVQRFDANGWNQETKVKGHDVRRTRRCSVLETPGGGGWGEHRTRSVSRNSGSVLVLFEFFF